MTGLKFFVVVIVRGILDRFIFFLSFPMRAVRGRAKYGSMRPAAGHAKKVQ